METIWKYIEYVFACIWNPLPKNDENGIDDANVWICECGNWELELDWIELNWLCLF